MSRKRYTPEQIIGKLREAEVALAQGQTVAQVCRILNIAEQTFYRWRHEYGGLKVERLPGPLLHREIRQEGRTRGKRKGKGIFWRSCMVQVGTWNRTPGAFLGVTLKPKGEGWLLVSPPQEDGHGQRYLCWPS